MATRAQLSPPTLLLTAALASLVLAVAPVPAPALVMKSSVPGAHQSANDAAQVELNRARSRLKLHNEAGALEALQAAARKDTLASEVFDALGGGLLRAGRYRAAYEAYVRAALLSPESAPIWNRIAQLAFLHLGLDDEGTRALGYSMQIDSTYSTAWYTRCIYHWSRGEIDLAERALARARGLETDQNKALIWFSTEAALQLARCEYGVTESALRVHTFEVPGDVGGRQALAQAQRALKKYGDADSTLRLLRAFDPTQEVWLVESGLAKRAAGQRDSALVFFAMAVDADSTAFDAGYDRALELAAGGDTAQARRELARLRGLDPGNYLVPLFAGKLAAAAGDTARARLAFEEARRLNPAIRSAPAAVPGVAIPGWSSEDLSLGEDLYESGDFTLAGDRFYKAGLEPARHAASLYWLSHTARLNAGALGLPVLAAQAGAEAANGDPILVRALAEAQWAARDTTRAIGNLEAVLHAAPGDRAAAALLAQALLARGDLAGARAVLAKSAPAPTLSFRVESVRAAILERAGDPGAAGARDRAAALDYLPVTGS